MKERIWDAQDGFTLIEVMISLTIFSIFIASYVVSEGYNVSDSFQMKSETVLQRLCEQKLNEILVNPPAFEESLTLTPQTGSFEEEAYQDYEYSVEYQRLKIPDLSQITGSEGEGDGEAEGDGQDSAYQKKVFEVAKKNVEEILWQVKVSVQQKGTEFPTSLSAFIQNKKAKIDIRF